MTKAGEQASPRWTFNLALAAAAAAGCVYGIQNLHALPAPPLVIGWPVLVALFALAEVAVIHVRTSSQTNTISVSEIPLVLGLMFATPANLLIGALAGTGLALVLRRRQRPAELSFNLASLAARTVLALMVFHAVVGAQGAISMAGWAGALAATSTSSVLAQSLALCAMALTPGAIDVRRVAQAFALVLAASFASTNLAIILANGITAGRYLVAPLIVLAGLMVLAYRALLAERGRRDHLEAQIDYKSFHDPLTSLANRALFRTCLQEAIDQGARGLAVIFVDIDDFKTVNDTLGHSVGDLLLAAVGQRIQDREAKLAARLGGDEFAILLEGVGQAEASRTAGRVLADLGRPIRLEDQEVSARASLGVAMHVEGVTADDLMRNADLAMYTAKRNGKGCFQFFEPEMGAAVTLRHQLKEDLNRAADNGEFENHYQPMVDLASGAITAVETLVRWTHPWAGPMDPDSFIPLAEETGAIVPIGRQVLATACRDGAAWRFVSPQLSVSVNVSARQLDDDSLLTDLAEILEATGFPPASLILEITESATMGDVEAVIGRLEGLKRLGVRLAMDDFGTGYSSLSQIRRLPIDILKIPKPFIDHMLEGSEGLETVRAILSLCRSLGLLVVAEGIEKPEQLAGLRDLTCGIGQGYLFGRPVAAHQMTRALAEEAARMAAMIHKESERAIRAG
ncbi:MAG TPA: EAL domain-containing protein [Acidimicrobiales bacterium]|nr:EAL domain-containing protein [Acidimicrobiales bacterium]